MSIAEKLTTVAENVEKVYEAGINNGIEQGEQDGIIAMWEAIQQGGKRTNYEYLCRHMGFTKKNFKPIYDIKLDGANAYSWTQTVCSQNKKLLIDEGTVNMKELEEEQGMRFDFSECTNLSLAFTGGLFTVLNVIDAQKASTLDYAFYNGYISGTYEQLMLKRIERLICSEITGFGSMTFGYCSQLEYIGFEGVIAKNIDVSSCPLIKESITKLFNTLSATAEGKTVTFKKSAVNAAFGINVDDETTFPEGSEYYTLRHSKDNWTVNYI